jgi:hypothetical protein
MAMVSPAYAAMAAAATENFGLHGSISMQAVKAGMMVDQTGKSPASPADRR